MSLVSWATVKVSPAFTAVVRSARTTFPLEGNPYGRSIGDAAPHRFLPGGKGGLYAWEQVRQGEEIILVEGLFDYAVLWQAGFHNVTCLLGVCRDENFFHVESATYGRNSVNDDL